MINRKSFLQRMTAAACAALGSAFVSPTRPSSEVPRPDSLWLDGFDGTYWWNEYYFLHDGLARYKDVPVHDMGCL